MKGNNMSNGSNRHKKILAKIAQECQANYSSNSSNPFDKPPKSTTAPLYHVGNIHVLDSVSSFKLIQNQIIYLDCKARNAQSFDSKEKEFLRNLFEVMWWGGKIRGFSEAAALADAYVNGNGKTLKISAEVYKTSKIVQSTQELMKEAAKGYFDTTNNTSLNLKSTDNLLKQKIAQLRKKKKFNQQIEGELYANGILKAEESNKRLFYADNRFSLQLFASKISGSNGKMILRWKVEGIYDFEPYNKRPWDITRLPVVHPGTKKKSQEEVQALLAEIFPEYMKVIGRYLNGLLLPDGLSSYMVSEGVAKPFTYFSEWSEVVELQ